MTLNTGDLTTAATGVRSNGQAPRCTHADELPLVDRGAPECAACLSLGWTWRRLVACLICGWVACSDDSPGAHARAHYRETDHAVVGSLEPWSTWRWCYEHDRVV
ncbi:UBP-type zinc finger domain-containing protein [Nonomuraea sp. NPDC050328]|uniref:UBP-type zinc finger domain-containing protein n=1 Tax=Nonomuraea sp. NPDC050328 TaxID=3364361 RepID=UPI003793D8CD